MQGKTLEPHVGPQKSQELTYQFLGELSNRIVEANGLPGDFRQSVAFTSARISKLSNGVFLLRRRLDSAVDQGQYPLPNTTAFLDLGIARQDE